MKPFLTSLFLLFAVASNAQSPWRAKLIIYFEDSASNLHPDTIWFGCDSLGADGFQEGLDVFDNRPLQENQVTGFDSVTNIQFPGKTLRTNIKAFKLDEAFNFQVRCNGIVKYIQWDTLEFKYHDNEVRYFIADIYASENVSFDIWHKYYVSLTTSQTQTEVLEGGAWLKFNIRLHLI